MTRWLLAAEADKIQDFVFRSSRLVQVVGGSGLLTRFCETVPPLLIERHTGHRPKLGDEAMIIAGGGSFRLTFSDPDVARAVGLDLAEAYFRATEGTLTVTDPQPYEPGGFKGASEAAESDLRVKKADNRQGRAATAQLPYMAICASCGVSLAAEHRARHTNDRPNYLCESCRIKGAERDMIWKAPEKECFLSRFYVALHGTEMRQVLPNRLPTEEVHDLFPRDAEKIGEYDPRNYVAYLVADGNGMGVHFSRCQEPGQIYALSQALTDAMWGALARATAQLVPRLRAERGKEELVPVMPLIVGGDDLFALLPAPYALDFARRVCLEFEALLRPALVKLWPDSPPVQRDLPTMSAAVVICKQNYPYGLAHRQGEALLGGTKRIARAARLQDGVNGSAVSFMVVRGGDLDTEDEINTRGRKEVIPTLTPYWVSRDLPDKAAEYGLNLERLLAARYVLRALPGKRREELRTLFMGELPAEGRGIGRESVLKALGQEWRPKLTALLDRIRRRPELARHVLEVLGQLGDPDSAHEPWHRLSGRPDQPFGHGMPDLLELWRYSQDLDKDLEAYEERGA